MARAHSRGGPRESCQALPVVTMRLRSGRLGHVRNERFAHAQERIVTLVAQCCSLGESVQSSAPGVQGSARGVQGSARCADVRCSPPGASTQGSPLHAHGQLTALHTSLPAPTLDCWKEEPESRSTSGRDWVSGGQDA